MKIMTVGAVLFVLCLLSLALGSARLEFSEFVDGLFHRRGSAAVIIYNIRLPRMLGGVVSGAGLALSGLLLQSVTDNKMASPNLIGSPRVKHLWTYRLW